MTITIESRLHDYEIIIVFPLRFEPSQICSHFW